MDFTSVHPNSFNRLGRKRPLTFYPRLKVSNYLKGDFPKNLPTSIDYSVTAFSSSKNVMLNNRLGCCTISGGGHIIGWTTACGGGEVNLSDADILKAYSACSGYVPGRPGTDTGCNEQDVLKYWMTTGIGGHKIVGWLTVDPSDKVLLQNILYLFQNLYFGVELPDGWTNPMPQGDGFTWDEVGAPDPEQGHCFVGFGYNDKGIAINTWAEKGIVTWNAVKSYCQNSNGGELYFILTEDSVNRAIGLAPNSLDFDTLKHDFIALGGGGLQESPMNWLI